MIQALSPAQANAFCRLWKAACVVSLLATALPAHAEGADVAIMPFDRRQLDATLTETLLDTFQIGFAQASGLSVIGQGDIVALVGLEKQKELMGCDTGSCVAELGGALGVRFMVVGRFAKVGTSYLLLVKMIDVTKGGVVAQDQETVTAGDEQRLLEGVQKLAARFGQTVAAKVPPATVAAPPKKNSTGTAARPAPPAESKASSTAAEPDPSGEGKTGGKSSGPAPWGILAAVNGVVAGLTFTSCLLGGSLGLLAGLLSQVIPAGAGFTALLSALCGCVCCVGVVGLGVGVPVNIWLYTRRPKPVTEDVSDPDEEDGKEAPKDESKDEARDQPAPPVDGEAAKQAGGETPKAGAK
jgi:TolB-like protein